MKLIEPARAPIRFAIARPGESSLYICYMRLFEWVWWWSFMRQYRDVSELCAALDFTWIRAHIVLSGRPTHRPDVFILAINSMLILLLFAYVRCSYGRAHLNEQPTTKAFLLCLFCWSRWENKKKKKKTTQSSVVNRFLNAVNGDIKTYSFSSYTLFSSLNYKNILSRREFMHARRWEINFNCTECDGCECWCSGIGQHANVHVFRTFNCNRTNRWWNSKTKNLEYRASLQPSEPMNRIGWSHENDGGKWSTLIDSTRPIYLHLDTANFKYHRFQVAHH